MKKLSCTTESVHKTEIYIQKGLRDHLFELDSLFKKYRTIVIITDENVAGYYLKGIAKQFASFGGTVRQIVLEPGEPTKNLGQARPPGRPPRPSRRRSGRA